MVCYTLSIFHLYSVPDCEYLDVVLLLDATSGYQTYIQPAALQFLDSIRSLIRVDRVRVGIVVYGESTAFVRAFIQPEVFFDYDQLRDVVNSVTPESGDTADLALALRVAKANLLTRNLDDRTTIHDLVRRYFF